jgi:pyroglutamyl-peptidase
MHEGSELSLLTPGRGPRLLLTGFDPFGGDAINASWQVAQALGGQPIAGHEVVAAQLPTRFGDSLARLDELMSEHRPVMVICLGQASTRQALSIERIAINVDDARIPDNAGKQPVDVPVVAGGPAAYFSRLPIKAMMLAARQEGALAEVSQTAGTFVCNHVFYGLMHRLGTRDELARVRGGFIHVPALPEQVTAASPGPSMTLECSLRGLRAALAAALAHREDIAAGAGSIG